MSQSKSQAGRITTHVLDTAAGRPAAGLGLELRRLQDGQWHSLGASRTNADGRCDQPLLEGAAMQTGTYEILFHAGVWRQEGTGREAGFYDVIPVRFAVTDPGAHHHVPLILAPFGYSTYRGS